MNGSVRRVAALAVVAGLALSLAEGCVELGLGYPALLEYGPVRLRDEFRRYYSKFDRDLIQFNPECAVYDPHLLYRLRPGRCTFANREFETSLEVNSLGVRDDEASLRAPRIVVVGDSLAMGWGVAQRDTFAERLERDLRMPVLNTAISSYGTVREMKMLARVDTSAMQTLIVQYCGNDFEENAAFFEAGNRHVSRTEAEWRAVVAENESRRRYFVGQHVVGALALSVDGWFGPLGGAAACGAGSRSTGTVADPKSAARLFLNALTRAGTVDLSRAEVVVVPLESWNRSSGSFARDLAAAVRDPRYRDAIGRVTVVDVSPHLTARHYFLLDGHLNAEGHAEVARRLSGVVANRFNPN